MRAEPRSVRAASGARRARGRCVPPARPRAIGARRTAVLPAPPSFPRVPQRPRGATSTQLDGASPLFPVLRAGLRGHWGRSFPKPSCAAFPRPRRAANAALPLCAAVPEAPRGTGMGESCSSGPAGGAEGLSARLCSSEFKHYFRFVGNEQIILFIFPPPTPHSPLFFFPTVLTSSWLFNAG